jgi:hypothetical protein
LIAACRCYNEDMAPRNRSLVKTLEAALLALVMAIMT